ncbi:MAG: hypothetical protein AUI16_08330 [Alphaproteobacteria bacterium 13_2_20CM_2_64_7]|nr:MAG: hypothetical protein AUI16_08330 [Alphaproteobacteria bacterium 13_2_20CM_2_64_7]
MFASVEHGVTRATKVGLMIARVEGDLTLHVVHQIDWHTNGLAIGNNVLVVVEVFSHHHLLLL